MRGRITGQWNLFVKINLEELVPANHPLRAIKRMADEALAGMGRTFAAAREELAEQRVGDLLEDFAGIKRLGHD